MMMKKFVNCKLSGILFLLSFALSGKAQDTTYYIRQSGSILDDYVEYQKIHEVMPPNYPVPQIQSRAAVYTKYDDPASLGTYRCKMRITAYDSDGHDNCDNYFNWWVKFPGYSEIGYDMNDKKNLNNISTNINAKSVYDREFDIPKGAKLEYIRFYSRRAKKSPAACKTKEKGEYQCDFSDFVITPGSKTSMPTTSNTTLLPGYKATAVVEFIPLAIAIFNQDGDNTGGPLPETKKVTYKVNKNFAGGSFTWYYKCGNDIEKKFPSRFQYWSSITFSGNDILDDFLKAVQYKLKIQIKARANAGGFESDWVVLDVPKEAPHMLANTALVKNPVCAGEATGSVKIGISPSILYNEVLYVAIQEENYKYYNTATLKYGASFLEFKDLPSGKYEIVFLSGTYPDATRPTYVGDPLYHKFRFELKDPPGLSLQVMESSAVKCKGGADGCIPVSATGGTGELYVLTSDQDSVLVENSQLHLLTGLKAGNYPFRLHDSKGCKLKDDANNELIHYREVKEPEHAVSVQQKGDLLLPSGHGLLNGQINVLASGGRGSHYVYEWYKDSQKITGASSDVLSDIGAGTYQVVVKDTAYLRADPQTTENTAGCIASLNLTLTQPEPLTVKIVETGKISCYGLGDGELQAVSSGGVGAHSYQWQAYLGGSWGNMKDKTIVAEDLYSGSYRVVCTDANNNQTISEPYDLKQPQPLSLSFNSRQPSCFGSRDGRVEAVVTGGIKDYTYKWKGFPETSAVITGGTDTYTVSVEDKNRCPIEGTVFLGQPTQLTASSAVVLPSAANASDGKITISSAGGTPGYTYHWDYHNSTLNPLTGILADSTPYHVVVKDAHQCQTELSPRVIYPLGVKIVVKKVVSCKGDKDGLLEAMPEGGISRYYRYQWYQWVNGSFALLTGNGKVSPGVGAGRYQVKVTDSENNTATSEITITEPSLLQASARVELPSSAYAQDSRITVSPSGGTPGYTYLWDYGHSASNPLTGIPADSTPYHVVVRDAHQCRVELNPRVIYPLGVQMVVKKVVSCKGVPDGLLEAMPEGGISRVYRYQWFKSGNGGFQEIAGTGKISVPLGAGTYRVKVTDSENNTATAELALDEPPALSATFTIDLPASASASDGRITVYPAGGTPYADGSYRYKWDYKGAETNPLVALPADSLPYHGVVRDAHQCEVEINPRILYPLFVRMEVEDSVSCYGRQDGRLKAIAEGGVSRVYFYKWYKKEKDSFLEIAGDRAVSALTGEGIYQVKVWDSEHNQAVSEEFVLKQPDSLSLKFEHSDPLCKDDRNGWLNVTVEGGTKPYRYLWEDKTGYDAWNRNDLPDGIYNVTVMDYHGCRISGRDTLREPDSLLVTHKVSFPTVYNGSDGTIRLFPAGGTEPYRFEWVYNHAAGNPLTGLPAREVPYEVTVTDAHGCTVVDTPRMYNRLIVEIRVRDSVSCYGRQDGRLAAVFAGGVGAPHAFEWYKKNEEGDFRKIGINDSILYQAGDGIYQVKIRDRSDSLAISEEFVFRHPDALELHFRHRFPLCKNEANGWTEARVRGGTMPYRYYWEDIRRESASFRDSLEDGSYKVVVSDRRGCRITGTDVLTEPDSLVVTHQVSFPSVYGGNDGTILLSPEGGTAPYRYAWNYNHSTANPLIGLSARQDPLKVVVTDAQGCRVTDSAYMYDPVTVEMEESGVIICSGQTNAELTAHVKGGTGKPYRYEWFYVEDDLLTRFEQTDSILKPIGVGTYRVVARDSAGNEGRSADYTVYSPDSLRLEFETGDLPCKYDKKGWIQAIPLGGEAPYRLEWFNGSAGTRVENLEEGRYEVKLTDKRGCFINKKVKINSPDELLLSIDSRDPLGWHRSDGAVWVTPVGGMRPYRYEWHDGEKGSDTLSGVPAGPYTVTVTDSHQCKKTISDTLGEPPLLEAKVSCTRIISCFNASDGALVATASGGVGGYRYDWYRIEEQEENFVVSGISCENVPAGEYKVRVTDGNGIIAWSETYPLAQPDLLQAEVRVEPLLCKGDTDGKAEAVVKGGTLPYEYIWTNGAKTEKISGVAEGRYLVAVKDAHGCRTEALGTVLSPPALEVESKITDPVCNGGRGSIALEVSGGTGKYSVAWVDGNGKMKRADLPAGNYAVEITDANGCLWKGGFELIEPEQIKVDLGPERTLCREQEIELAPLDRENFSEYNWFRNEELFSTRPVVRIADGGTYRLEVATRKGCRGSGEVTIAENDAVVDANFAMASEVEAGDILKVVNTCLPVPEYCEWLIPESAPVRVVSDDKELAELIFDLPGNYKVGLRSTVGKCEEILYKDLTVVPQGAGQPAVRGSERVIGDIQVWPNPSDGHFKVRVSLNKKSAGLLRMYALTGVLLREIKCQGEDRYEFSFNESLPAGVYVLHLIFGNEREAVKVAVE